MADYPSVAILLGLLSLTALYFALRFYQKVAFVALACVMILLSAVGSSIATGGSKILFETVLVLSLIALPLTILHFILSFTREVLEKAVARGKGM